MSVVDLHPEDLIDKLVEGALTPDERQRLQAHLQACAECRFELSVRGDLADEALAARPHTPPPLGPLTEPAPLRAPGRRPRRALLLGALAAALVAGGSLAAVVSEVVRTRHAEALARLERQVSPAARPPHVAPARAAVPQRTAPEVQSVAPAPPESSATPLEAVAPAGSVPTALVRGPRPLRGAPRPKVEHPPAVPTEAPPQSAAGLFSAANRARRYGDASQAMSLYRALQETFPASEEARLSRATLATLQLDRGEASAALDGFDGYLAQGGGAALGAEALVGRAVALGKLGRSTAELEAWREVERRFPGTAHAKRAAFRIAALSGR